jgi:Cu/Ag efflux protein CusF
MAQGQDQQTTLSGVQATEYARTTATVQDIDTKDRIVTLKEEDGKVSTIQVGDLARNFDQLRKGDKVTFHFMESQALALDKSGEPPTANEKQELIRAEPGQMPGGMAVNTTQITAVVEKINHETREVTLSLPEGKTKKVNAAKGIDLNNLQKGEDVTATITDAIAIDVTRPGN